MPTPFPTLAPASNLDEVVERIDTIVTWSIANANRLGYFAALYKRITRAIGAAVASGDFEDGPRMVRLDATFANRYFTALNGYFNPAHDTALSQCWRVAFEAAMTPARTIVTHMLAGVKAHIELDLGIATYATAAPGPIESIRADFITVNTVLTAQVKTVLDEIDSISPVLAALYDVTARYEIATIDELLVVIRERAWSFASLLAVEPRLLDGPTIAVRDAEVATLASLVLDPPSPFASIIAAIARQESADVARNIRILDGIASEPIVDACTVASHASTAV
ncbi:MAG: DUF5995 family protein [Candidatus Velthaea sp.]